VAVARLAKACAVTPDGLDFSRKLTKDETRQKQESTARAMDVAQPPSRLTKQ
jgi:hypothetical protein